MQLRELLNNQSILTPLISVKSISQDNGLDAFNQILTEKTNDSSIKKNVLKERPEPNEPLKREGLSVGFRNDTPQYEPVKKNEQAIDKKESITTREEQQTKKVSEPKTDSEQDSIKKMLKERLKKRTGLSDAEVDEMISAFVADPSQILSFFESNDAFVSELKDIMIGLELGEVFGGEMQSKDMKQLLTQLEHLIDSLVKHSDESGDIKSHADSEQGSAFEMKIVNALSKLIAEIEHLNPEAQDVKASDIRKMLVEALARTDQKSVQTDQPDTDGTLETNNVQKSPILPISQTHNQSQTQTQSQSDLKQPEPESGRTLVNVNAVHSEPMTDKTGEMMGQAVHVEESNGLKDESSKGIFAHQIMMKQGNVLTTQTIQTSPLQRQEIFTQIMDAIKGNIKLSDDSTTMLIKLQPEQLGNVELKLNLHKGIVLAEIKVENEMVKAAIESNLDDLKQSLNNKGYAIEQLNVSVDSGKKNRQEAFGGSRKGKSPEKNEKSEAVELIENVNKYIVDEYEGSTINYYG